MAIDIRAETILTLSDLRENHIPRKRGRPVAPSTLWRWIHRGCRAADGTIIKLEIVRIGGQPMTTLQALDRFFTELTQAGDFDVSEIGDERPGRTHEKQIRLRQAGLC